MYKSSLLLKLFVVSFLFSFISSNNKSVIKAQSQGFDVSIEFRGFVYGEVLVKGLEWRFSSMIANHSDSSLYCNFKAYFSTDEYLDESDTMIIDKDIYLGAKNEVFKEEYFTLERGSQIKEGIYYLIVNIDKSQSLPDVQRDNNTFIVPMIVEDNPTDLFPSNLEVSSININTTDNIQFDYTLTNTSRYTVNYIDQTVYISNDSVLDYDEDIVLLSDSRGLNANSNYFEWIRTIPEGLGVGDYYLIVDLDKNNVIAEPNEENNQLFKQLQIIEEPVECDIEIRKVGIYPKRVFAGEQIYMDFDITNSGNITTWVDNYAYLSTDSLLGSDTYLYYDRNVLSPGKEITNVFSYDHVYIPNYIIPGHYNVICTVESSEENGTLDNNLIIYPIDVITELNTAVPPDFEILDLSLSDSIVYIDEHISSVFSYCNNTEGEISQEIALIAYLSTDSILDKEDPQFEGSQNYISPRKHDTIKSYSSVYNSLDILPGDYYIIFKIDGNNIASEIDEENNLFVQKAKFKEKPRDIRLRLNGNENRLIFENSFIKDVIYELNFSVLSDDIIEGDSILISYVLSDTLAINENSQELVSDTIIFRSYERPKLKMPASVPAGKYFLKVEASTLKNYTDDNLADNYVWISAYIFENNIDLQLDTFLNKQKSVFSYQLFEVNVNYSNLSKNYIDEAQIRFYLSEDTILDSATDILLSDLMNTNLTCFENKSETVELSIQSELPSGSYYIISSITYKNNFEEENQLNNTAYDTIFIKPNLGDLIIHEILTDIDTLVQGQITTGDVEILNIGNRSLSSSYMSIFFSTDSLLSSDDILLDSTYCESLYSNAIRLTEFNVELPADAQIGDNYIIFSLDHSNQSEEVSDTNNIASIPVFVVEAFVDLFVDSAYSELDTLGQGLTIQQKVSLGVKGNAAVEIARLNIYLSTDSILDLSNDSLLNEQLIFDLQPESEVEKDVYITIPTDYNTGKAYIIYDVSIVENDFQDLLLGNNRFFNKIEIQEAHHNLVCDWINNDDVALLEGEYEVLTYDIINKGNTDETVFFINTYLSIDSIADEGDSLLLSAVIESTIFGGKQERTNYYFSAPYDYSGEYYLILDIVSENDLAFENIIHKKIILTDGYLDFAVKMWTCPRIIETTIHDYFEAKIVMQNKGDVRIISPYVELYYSEDSVLDDNDYLAESHWQNVLSTTYNNKVPFLLSIPEDFDKINYILLVADPRNELKEENEENNFEYYALNFVSDETKGNIQFEKIILTSDTALYTLNYSINKDKYIKLDTIQIQVSWCSDTLNPAKNLLCVDSIFNWGDKTLSRQIAIDSNLINDAEANYLCIEILKNDYDTVYSNNVQYIQLKSPTTVEIGNELDIDVFPNPVENELHINSDFYIEEIRIYNLQGVLLLIVSDVKSNEAIINLESLKPSEYFIGIKGENNSIIRKVIKK